MLNSMGTTGLCSVHPNFPSGCLEPKQQASTQVQAMKVIGLVEVESVVDVTCDVCGASTRMDEGGYQYGTLQAHWGYGTKHDGERYEAHLCEHCFFLALANLKEERRAQRMFDADAPEHSSDLGLLARNDFFKDAGH